MHPYEALYCNIPLHIANRHIALCSARVMQRTPDQGHPRSTNFQIHEDLVAMETELCISNKEFDMSDGLHVYATQLT